MNAPPAECVIAYEPMRGEPDWRAAPFFKGAALHMLGQDASVEPFRTAENYKKICVGQSVAILIPGTRFDMRGTRHGRGGGWFDRFLSAVPREWVRVGVLFDHQLSATPLIKASHDEVMDWLLICASHQWSLKSVATL